VQWMDVRSFYFGLLFWLGFFFLVGVRRIGAVKTQGAGSLDTDACQSAARPVWITIQKW
jgi:hypothetical protein